MGRLVLWDVDHTLIDTGGLGGEIFQAAFEQVTGQAMVHASEGAGRTEPEAFRAALEVNNIPERDGYFTKFAEIQAQAYEDRAQELRQRGRPLPGVREVLAHLAELSGIVQSVLTGNPRASAEAKLHTFGLDTYLDFDAGAYGDDEPIRAHLVPIARQRAGQRYGVSFDATTTVLIGDTPKDVAAGREGGALVIGVATGLASTVELATAGADASFADLTQPDVLPAIRGEVWA